MSCGNSSRWTPVVRALSILLLILPSVLPLVDTQLHAQLTPIPPLSLSGWDATSSQPYGLCFHPTQPWIYVALSGEIAFPPALPEDFNGSTVVELHMGSLQVLRTFDVGFFPTEVAVSGDGGELYVVNSTDVSLSRINLSSGAVTTVTLVDNSGLPVTFPSAITVSPDGSELWITSNGGNLDGSDENIVILDRASLTLVNTVLLNGGLSRFAVRADGRVVMPVGFPGGVFPSNPEVRIYDTAAGGNWVPVATVTLVTDLADFPGPVDVALHPNGSRAYVTVLGGSSELFVIDVDNATLLPSIAVPGSDFSQYGVGVNASGDRIYLSQFNSAQLHVIDSVTSSVVQTVATESLPNSVRSHGGRVWVSNQGSESLSIFVEGGGFLRGDVNLDGTVTLPDALALLGYLFLGSNVACVDRVDINDDGNVQLGDAIALLQYLFLSGAAPGYPFPDAGSDLTPDSLLCDE